MGKTGEDEFERALDAVITAARQTRSDRDIAQVLVSTANGLLRAGVPRPKWNESEGVLVLPFCTAEQLEQSLEDLLTRKAVCVSLDETPPLLRDLTLRVQAADTSVDLAARSVQNTASGVVLQITAPDVATQRSLINLIATLRMKPIEPVRLDVNSHRAPDLETLPSPPAPAPAPAEQPVVAPPSSEANVVQPEPTPKPKPQREPAPPQPPAPAAVPAAVKTMSASDRAVLLERVEAAETRLRSRSHFEVLGLHFTAVGEEVEEAWNAIATTCEEIKADADDALRERLDELCGRSRDSYEVLRRQATRHKHRLAVTNTFQLEGAVEMYERKADTHKIRREIEDAIEAYRRIVELKPDDRDARHQLAALEALAETG